MEMVRQWVDKISVLVGVAIQCTDYVRRMLVNRANYLRGRCKLVRRNGGGRQRAAFLQQVWTFKVPYSQVTFPDSLVLESTVLKDTVRKQQDRLQACSHLVCRLQEHTEGGTKRRKRTAKEYSKRHEHRLKKIRADSCAASLAWLESEGLTPIQVVVHDQASQKLEEITLDHDLAAALSLNGETPSNTDLDIVTMMLYVKDRFSVSEGLTTKWQSCAKQCPGITS